jgi:hypothetical protein
MFHIVWIIFEFLMPVSNYIQNGGQKLLSPGLSLAELEVDL